MPGPAKRAAEPERHHGLAESEVVRRLKLRRGMRVAEFGAGTGRFTLAIARAVGPRGRVFAIEIQPEMLDSLRQAVAGGGNVEIVESPHHHTPLPDGACDRILIANLWTELPDAAAVLREVHRLLREDGRVLLIERHAALPDLVHALEHQNFDVHGHGTAAEGACFLEAGISDESVQS